MRNSYTIAEYGLIRRLADSPGSVSSADELFLPDAAFDALKGLASEPDAEGILTFSLQKGREIMRAKNYVGLLETRNRTQLEILPKITSPDRRTAPASLLQKERGELPSLLPSPFGGEGLGRSGGPVRLHRSRSVLLRMLQHVRNSPFRQVGMAHLNTAQLPLWEVFITAFLAEVSPLIAQGLNRSYVETEDTLPVIRGKLQIAEQLRQNVYHAERFAVSYDEFTADIPPNRLLRSCLDFVKVRARTLTNQTRIRQLLFALDDVPASVQVARDMKVARLNNRLLARYEPVLRWAEVLLMNQSFGVSAGRHLTLSLLFPMERVFEEYVATGFRRYAKPGDELTIQESSAYLIDEHSGGPRFRLRPDIILRRDEQLIVLDTKWKTINGLELGTDAGNYGIDQTDLYQLYAYGKKYNATQLVLIYPANETFTQPLNLFGYDPTLPLRVVPFNVMNALADEVETILNLTLSSRSI